MPLLRLYNDKSSAPVATTPRSSSLLRLYADTPTTAKPSASSASPSGLPQSYASEPAYGASNRTDLSGKPLLTFRNDKVGMSQLLTDRVYPGIDPSKPQKLDKSLLVNGRMPLEISSVIKKQLGGTSADELDHKIALELSGSNNPTNLKIEPGIRGGLSAQHDQLENQLARDAVAGKISLIDAHRTLLHAKGETLPEDMTREQLAASGPIKTFKTPDVPAPKPAGSSIGEKALNTYPSTMQTLAELQIDPASLKADPHKAITDYWNGVKDSVKNAEESIAQYLTARDSGEKVGSFAKAAASTVGAALSPITSLFAAANDIPIVGMFSKLITLPFQFMGDAGHDTAKVLVDSLPIHQDTKAKIVDGIGDMLALAGQFAIGSVSEKGGSALDAKLAHDALLERSHLVKGSDLVKKYGLDDAKTIVEKAKEIATKKSAAPATLKFSEKPLTESKTTPSAERAGFVNPQAFTDSLKEALAKAKEGQDSAKFGEALRTYFTGERDSRVAETNQLRDQLSKGLSPKEQEALTLMRDFKNKPAELDAFENGAHDAYAKLPKADRPAAIERVKALQPIIDLAKNPTENMKAADAAMTDYFTKHLDEGKNLGFLDSKIKNDEYISHLLQPKDNAGKVVSKGGGLRTYKIGRNTPFSKERTYPTVLDAIANGVEPRTLNALDALTIYGDKHATAAATRLLVDQLKDSGVAKWGSHGSDNVPADWKPIAPENNRLFQNQVPFVDKNGTANVAHQSLFAPEKVVDALRPITDPDYTSQIPGFQKSKLYQAYLKSVELGLSAFHLKALNITALGNEGITGLVKSYATDMKSPAFLEAERALIKAGGTSPILGRTIEAYRELQPSSIPTRMDLLRSLPVFKQFDQLAAKTSKLTFDIVQRKMKVTDFAMKDAKWIADHPEATPSEHYVAQRSIAKEINATYGGLNWEAMGVNKMTHSVLRAILLAPDWTFSNFANVKGAFQGGPGGNAARAFWLRSAITGVALTQATSLLLSGKTSKDPTSVYLGKDPNGRDIYQNLFFAGAPGDFVNLLKNVQDKGAIAGLAQTLQGKLAPILRTGIQTVTNKDYLGNDIVPAGAGVVAGTGRSAINIGSQLGPVPFSLSNIVQMLMDPKKQYTEKEYVTTLLGGTRPRHVVPDGMRQVTSGKKKGQIVPATPKVRNSPLDIIRTGKVNQPAKKK